MHPFAAEGRCACYFWTELWRSSGFDSTHSSANRLCKTEKFFSEQDSSSPSRHDKAADQARGIEGFGNTMDQPNAPAQSSCGAPVVERFHGAGLDYPGAARILADR